MSRAEAKLDAESIYTYAQGLYSQGLVPLEDDMSNQPRQWIAPLAPLTKAEDLPVVEEKDDPVNHPKHYSAGGFEAIKVIEAWELGFCLGNTVKYISRAGKKADNSELQDLKKAAWYLNRRIAQIEGTL